MAKNERTEKRLSLGDKLAVSAARVLARWVGNASGEKREWKRLRDDLADFLLRYDKNVEMTFGGDGDTGRQWVHPHGLPWWHCSRCGEVFQSKAQACPTCD